MNLTWSTIMTTLLYNFYQHKYILHLKWDARERERERST